MGLSDVVAQLCKTVKVVEQRLAHPILGAGLHSDAPSHQRKFQPELAELAQRQPRWVLRMHLSKEGSHLFVLGGKFFGN